MNRDHDRLLLRAAVRMHERYAALGKTPMLPELPGYLLAELQQLCCRQQMADRMRLSAAAREVREDYALALDRLARHCQELAALSRRCSAPETVPSLRTLYEELCGLFTEFEDVEIDLRARTLAIRTGRIVLDDVDLGEFEIRLDWNSLGSHQAYEVIAIDPHPAAKSSDTTHPHVQSGSLCEGDGHAAIKAALNQGRLGDFFLIVRSILDTYNPSSAYTALDEWDGLFCQECDVTVPGEDTFACERCGWRLCCECVRSCSRCGGSFCAECEQTCSVCDLAFCRVCIKTCDVCQARTCFSCLQEGRCPACGGCSAANGCCPASRTSCSECAKQKSARSRSGFRRTIPTPS
jgi:hypothetical protein